MTRLKVLDLFLSFHHTLIEKILLMIKIFNQASTETKSISFLCSVSFIMYNIFIL